MPVNQNNLQPDGPNKWPKAFSGDMLPSVDLYGSGAPGSPCRKDGQMGILKTIDGKLTCVIEGNNDMSDQTLTEAAMTLTFKSPSRDRIAVAYQYWGVYANFKNAEMNVLVSPIQGSLGNWSFTVASNVYNQFLDPANLKSKVPAGVTVSMTRGGTVRPNFDSAPQPQSVKEKVNAMIKEALGIKENYRAVQVHAFRDENGHEWHHMSNAERNETHPNYKASLDLGPVGNAWHNTTTGEVYEGSLSSGGSTGGGLSGMMYHRSHYK